MKKTAFLALLVMVFVGVGCLVNGGDRPDNQGTTPTIDRDAILFEARKSGLIMDENEVAMMAQAGLTPDPTGRVVEPVDNYLEMDLKGWPAAALADVTGGESYGIAHARLLNGKFTFVAELGNLPEPAGGYFYQGWLVRRGEQMAVVSTGVVVKTQKGYANVYTSLTDLTEYDFYVLTLESDDGVDLPAEHILEGGIKTPP
jgi:hypothetical protein